MTALRTLVLPLATLLLATAAAPAGAQPDPPARPSSADRLTERMVEKINAVREKRGLPALREAPRLKRTATSQARWIVKTDAFAHGERHRRAGFRKSGEILAFDHGWKTKPIGVIKMWLRSGGHASLLLSTSFRYVGVAPARGKLGSRPTTVWVAQFGAH